MKLKFHLLNNSYLKLKLDFAYVEFALYTRHCVLVKSVFHLFLHFICPTSIFNAFHFKLTFILRYKSIYAESLISTFVCLFIYRVQILNADAGTALLLLPLRTRGGRFIFLSFFISVSNAHITFELIVSTLYLAFKN